MSTRLLTPLLVVVAVLATGGDRAAAAAPKPAPDVTLRTADGAPIRLADYKGKVVLVDFWASWCAPCKQSFPALDRLYRDYEARGVEVLAVNLDEQRRDADAFLAAEPPHEMPVLFDPDGRAPTAFGVKGMPSSFLIDRDGRIRFSHMGYSGSVADQYRREIATLLAEPS